jgi:hypothetical protein
MFASRRFPCALLVATTLACALVPSPTPRARAADYRYIQDLQVDPRHPQTLYIDGQDGCTDDLCSHWAARSRDGGRTWTDLTRAVLSSAPAGETDVDFDPLLLDGDGRTLVAQLSVQPDASPGGQSWYLIVSHDQGATWTSTGPTGGFDGGSQYGYSQPATEPRAPGWIYAMYVQGDYLNSPGVLAVSSRDGGQTWREGGEVGLLDNLMIDPRTPSTVYGNCADQSCPIRSLDAGKTWSRVTHPPGLNSFTVSFDAHEPGLLVGRSTADGVPAETVYLSKHGATWRAASCPGDLHGTCPSFTSDNAFGAGRAYGFYKDGIHPFVGAGAAGPRLAISAHLPAPAGHLLAVAGGRTPHAPVYLLASGRHSHFDGLVYRSADAGRSWRLVNPRA